MELLQTNLKNHCFFGKTCLHFVRLCQIAVLFSKQPRKPTRAANIVLRDDNTSHFQRETSRHLSTTLHFPVYFLGGTTSLYRPRPCLYFRWGRSVRQGSASIGHENASQERRRNDEAALDVRGVCFGLIAVFMDRNGFGEIGFVRDVRVNDYE